jgi:DNA polymerase-1
VFDVHKNEIEQMQQLVKKAMEDAVAMEVPMEVEMKTAPNWLEAH